MGVGRFRGEQKWSLVSCVRGAKSLWCLCFLGLVGFVKDELAACSGVVITTLALAAVVGLCKKITKKITKKISEL